MGKYFDEQGNEVEAFTEDEMTTKNKEAIDEYIEKNPDKSEELENAKKELEEAQGKLKEAEDGDGDDGQKKRLKEAAISAKGELDVITEKFSKEMKELKDGILSGHKITLLEKLSGGDKEIEKKIEFEADKYSGDPANEIELAERLKNAATIVNAEKPIPGFIDGLLGSGERGDIQKHKVDGPESPNSKEMRGVLGISDEDVKEFSSGEEGSN